MIYPNLGIYDPFDQFVRHSETYLPPFTPRNISGLQLWLDATDTDTVSTTGNVVNSWTDKSTNGYVFLPTGTSGSITYESGKYISLTDNGSGPTESLRLNDAGVLDFIVSNGANTHASMYFVVDQIYDVSISRGNVISNIFQGTNGSGKTFRLYTDYDSPNDYVKYQTRDGAFTYNNLQSQFIFNHKTVVGFRFGKNPSPTDYNTGETRTVDNTYTQTGTWNRVESFTSSYYEITGDSVECPLRVHEGIIYDNIIGDTEHNKLMNYLYGKHNVSIDRRILWASGDTILLPNGTDAWRWP